MNAIMSFISCRTFGSNQAVIEKRAPATSKLVTRANATEFGLGAGILAKDICRAHLMADQLRVINI